MTSAKKIEAALDRAGLRNVVSRIEKNGSEFVLWPMGVPVWTAKQAVEVARKASEQ